MPKKGLYNFLTIIIVSLSLAMVVPLKAQSVRKVARDFTKDIQKNHRTILIHEPEFLYKFNLKLNHDKRYAHFTKKELDALAYDKSEFVKNIQDSLFLHFFTIGYLSELKKFGFQPFINKMPTPSNKPDYYANIVQAELDEQYYPYRDTAYLDRKAYVFKRKLNALDVSFWFKVYAAGAGKTKENAVYYAENLLVDDIQGQFSMTDKGALLYYYKIHKLTIGKIYQYASGLGKNYAYYTFDQLMNNYIEKRVPASKIKGKYWHYDPVYKDLFPGDYDRFVLMK